MTLRARIVRASFDLDCVLCIQNRALVARTYFSGRTMSSGVSLELRCVSIVSLCICIESDVCPPLNVATV
jgi:hypothetical protein